MGVAGAVFYVTLLGAGGIDMIATQLHLSIELLVTVLRGLLAVGPVLAFVVTRSICQGLQHWEREDTLRGPETGQILRLASGEYVAKHRPRTDPRQLVSVGSRPADPPTGPEPAPAHGVRRRERSRSDAASARRR